MRIALVHDFLLKLGGAERVLKVLADHFPHAPIYTLLYDHKRVGGIFPKDRVRTSSAQHFPRFLRRRPRYLLPFLTRAIEEFDLSAFDVVLSSNSAFAHGIITNTATRHICYYHSPMRYAWDWTHRYPQEQHVGFLRRFAMNHILHRVRQWDFDAADRVDVPIANSVTVRRRIAKYYRQNAPVIYPPVDVRRFKITHEHQQFFLIVSTLSPYKRIDLAVQLFNKTGRKLVIIGDGTDRARLQDIATENVTFLGKQSDAVVTDYLQRCRGLIFPGEDDFGITPVEAMACGKPVLAYGHGGARETVIPGVTGELFMEPTIASIESGLARLLLNESRYDRKMIRAQAEKFAPSVFLKEIDRVIKDAVQ